VFRDFILIANVSSVLHMCICVLARKRELKVSGSMEYSSYVVIYINVTLNIYWHTQTDI
jgi:hypothetical protein